jgi:hypothetical protein
MNPAQLINQSSGDVEIYTPPEIVEPARRVLGGIDLDPASSDIANLRICARDYYAAPRFEVAETFPDGLPVRRYVDSGGLDRPWKGRIFHNPPFSPGDNPCRRNCAKIRCVKRGWHTCTELPSTGDWIMRAEYEHATGTMTEAIVITFAATSEAWFQPLMRRPQCFPCPRTNYLKPDGTVYRGVTKGSAVTYYGREVEKFRKAFTHLGVIKLGLV